MLYQKPTLVSLCLVIFSFILPQWSIAQGVYDVQFANVVVDCDAETLCFDIEVKANSPGAEFLLGNANIRFSFSRNLDNPVIVQESGFSGFIPGIGPSGFSLYAPHNLTGSLDTIVSYNVILDGGDGELVGATNYVSIGRMCLDIVDFDEPVELILHTEDIFPPTFVSNSSFTALEGGTFTNYTQDISDICDSPPSDEGMYDLQFANVTVDCEEEILCFDIEVKASAPGTEFFLGLTNIRFGFSGNLANPIIEQELDISGTIMGGPGPAGFTAYGPHNLNGSSGTLVSYNIPSVAGDGVYIESTDYVGIGRVCLDILNFDIPVTLMFNMEITAITTPAPNAMVVSKGTFTSYEQDISFVCDPPDEGAYDLQFANVTVDCEEEILCFDLEIKASAPGTEFLLGDFNIRFGFSTNLDNPVIEQELDISGSVPGPGPQGFSAYSPHNLTGSLDTVVSYNVEFITGDGIFIGATDYVGIGRMCVDILDFDMPATLMFNMEATFPPTFVGSAPPDIMLISEGTFTNYEQDISFVCDTPPPAEEVPTVGEWGLIILALLMSITAVVGIRTNTKSVVSQTEFDNI